MAGGRDTCGTPFRVSVEGARLLSGASFKVIR